MPRKPKLVEHAIVDPMDRPARVYADSEPREGFFAKVIEGPYAGRYGVVASFGDLDAEGRPIKAVLLTRDDEAESLVVDYDALRPDTAGRR